MAKESSTKETVSLVSPKGTKVTVAATAADKFKAKGYKAPRAASTKPDGDAGTGEGSGDDKASE